MSPVSMGGCAVTLWSAVLELSGPPAIINRYAVVELPLSLLFPQLASQKSVSLKQPARYVLYQRLSGHGRGTSLAKVGKAGVEPSSVRLPGRVYQQQLIRTGATAWELPPFHDRV